MNLILVGCEYAGTTTIAEAVREWGQRLFGAELGFHDHFKIPHVSHPPGLTAEEQQQFLALSPNLKEMFQRYHVDYHLQPSFYADNDHNMVGFHIDEAVYAPLYYGYGLASEYGDRVETVRHVEHALLTAAPDTVLILVKASRDAIAMRMKDDPHENQLVQEKDIDHVLKRFEEEYARSQIRRKFVLDTTSATVEETMVEFDANIRPHLTEDDRMRMMVHQRRARPGGLRGK